MILEIKEVFILEFIDYKCLESLLIEGEDLIATEGLGNAIINIIKNAFRIIKKFFDIIIGSCRKLIQCIRQKIAKSKTTQVDKEYKSIDVNDINHFIALVHNLNIPMQNALSCFNKISNYNTKNEYISEKDNDDMNKAISSFLSECDKIHNKRKEIEDKYKDRTYTITDSYADKVINELDKLIYDYHKTEESLTKCADKIDSLSNEFNSKNNESSAKLYKTTSELAKTVSQSISLVNGSINDIVEIILNSIIIFND